MRGIPEKAFPGERESPLLAGDTINGLRNGPDIGVKIKVILGIVVYTSVSLFESA